MAQTRRVTYDGTSPSTEYGLGANIVAQSISGNYSVVRISATCINRGGTTSFSGYSGSQTCKIDGYSGQAKHSGTLPSGVADNAVRWDIDDDITIAHASDGTKAAVTLRQTIAGWHTSVKTASFGGFPRIIQPPGAPGPLVFSEITPTSVRVTFTASTDDGGDPIYGYWLRYKPYVYGYDPTPWTSHSESMVLTRVVTGLTPGVEYTFTVAAHNDSTAYSGYGTASTARQIIPSTVWVKVSGVWKRAIPFFKVDGVWRRTRVYIKDGGTWKNSG